MKNMKSFLALLAVAVIFTLTSCGGGYTYQWVQPKYEKQTYKNIAVVGITQNLGARSNFERSMVAALAEQGVKATSSLDAMGGKNMQNASAEEVEQFLKQKGYDGVITAAVISKDKETNYVPGATYSAYPSYYGRGFRGYYGYYGGMIQEPGYYTSENVYMIQFNFYQLDNPGTDDYNALVWTVQDKVSQPSNPEKFNKKYSASLVESMKADGII